MGFNYPNKQADHTMRTRSADVIVPGTSVEILAKDVKSSDDIKLLPSYSAASERIACVLRAHTHSGAGGRQALDQHTHTRAKGNASRVVR